MNRKLRDINSGWPLWTVLFFLIVITACSVNVKKAESGKEKKVDIETPVGAIHVNNEADVRDTGLPVYPGARPAEKDKDEDGEEKSANVNISSGFFGVKVVAMEFQSNDPPDKVLAFYQKELKRWGSVLECHTREHGGDVNMEGSHDPEHSKLNCEGDNSGNVVELKVGTKQNQHLVSVEPRENGKGSKFALVYIQTRGGKDTI